MLIQTIIYVFSSAKKAKGETISGPILLEQYVAVTDYKKNYKEELSLKAGVLVDVIEKKETGEYKIQ